MCERRLVCAVLLVASMLASAGSAAAQSDVRAAAAQRAALERARIDSLLPLLEQAGAEVQRRKVAEQQAELAAAGKLDTVAVGPLLVVGRRHELDFAVPLVRTAWSDYELQLGDAARRLDGVTFLVQRARNTRRLGELSQRPRHYQLGFSAAVRHRGDRPDLLVRGALNAAVFALMPASVQAWLGGGFAAEPHDARAYRELVLSNSIGAERCLQRVVDACAALLGVVEPGRDWAAWYTPEQLRALARLHRLGVRPHGAGCSAADDPAACVAAFVAAGGPPPPLGQHARASLLHHVLRHGGAGSLERLVADSGADPGTALARASGGSLDGAIAAWQQAVLGVRPAVYADLGRSLLVTLLWCGLLLTFALRSTRWRTG